jgi:tRNA/tmRNA/rRNA uracil-C5-methylase (TrmA/RlmC/RlmD family)
VLPPGCEPRCHGCRHRALDLAASRAQKQDYLLRTLDAWSGRLRPLRATDVRLGYRQRVTLTAAHVPTTGWHFGLVRRDELIAIHDCPVHDPRVRALVHHLVRRLPAPEVLPLAFLQVAGGQATLIVKTREVAASALDGVVRDLETTGIEGLWLHLHPAAGRRLFARSGWRLVWGSGESRDGLGLVHGPTAFMQPLPVLHLETLDAAAEYLQPGPGASVLDLYCGHGATLRRWTATGARALGVELSGEAVRDAARNAPGAEVLRGTCAQRLPQIREWWHAGSGARLAYLNPPRSGLDEHVAQALARELSPGRLAYLSCSAGTLARDLAEFERAGYHVEAILPFDFFPQTHHVEALALAGRAG